MPALQAPPHHSSRGFPLIQALRAMAAMSVAAAHILHDALLLNPSNTLLRSVYQSVPWDAGVDIFFVISGFVIAHSSRSLFARPTAAQIFLIRRLARIVLSTGS